MYLFEKKSGCLFVSKVLPDMDRIIKAKEKEVYEKIDYLKMLKATNGCEEDILLQDIDPREMGYLINLKENGLNLGDFHHLEEEKVDETVAFDNLRKVITSPLLKTVKYYRYGENNYLALTNPIYILKNNIKEMNGIVPISEKLYEINHLMSIINNGTLDDFLNNIKEEYRKEFCSLLKTKEIEMPVIKDSEIETICNYELMPNGYESFQERLEKSEEILKRIRTK